jgi:hypothetical protein
MKMRKIPEDAVCVICGSKEHLGVYGEEIVFEDKAIYVCFDCYNDPNDKFRKWLDERGIE